MATASGSDTNDLFIALAHPLRRLILREMIAAKREISPTELADSLEYPLSKLSYHVRVLAECGAVELRRTRPTRGSTQHFYCLTMDAAWARSALRSTSDPPPRDGARGEEIS